ncbi:hypothetical protein ATO6_11705 [Oceanicola sp. 22II-s10i]|uniref:enoyl-CoA hydratase/isomerase family protein n=1 Tax=Oceanicola sp. 22II-s10i TaxID=1317116 RepID=UPI000B5217A8|nr:enoyl-CoA hydratase/isomerase family protein [Oceanicola sp. 22II-s10i]OWU84375.1 hypothetical protein ATO6_11705 [Oceanicola sp. 22II-s10i]
MTKYTDPALWTKDAPVLYEVRNRIAYITLNRPEVRNAMDGPMADMLKEAWIRLEADEDALVGVLCANGDHFSVGKDLKEKDDSGIPHRLHQAYPPNGTKLFKPLIAAVQGYCMGGAYGFAMRGSDITIAADDMILGFPEAKAGIAIAPIGYLPLMPFKLSLEYMLLSWKGGRFIDAKKAAHFGIVNEVVPREKLMEEATRWAEMLLEIPPMYTKAIKVGHYRDMQLRYLQNEYDYVDYIHPQQISEDRQEALNAFFEKRTPHFKNR